MHRIFKQNFVGDVDKYLLEVPEEARIVLHKIRSIIKTILPQAEEVISHEIPSYKYHGMLVGFEASENFCELHVMSPAVMKAFRDRLQDYDIESGIVRLRLNRPLDIILIKDLLQARIKENEFYATMLS